jgi:hypothetical protein
VRSPTPGSSVAEARSLWLAQHALLALAVPIALALFAATNPYFLRDWQHALADLEHIARVYREGHTKPVAYREAGLPHLLSACGYLLNQAFATNPWLSVALSGTALLGLARGLWRPRAALVFGLLHAALLVVGMAWPNRAYLTRMYLPAMPVLCLGFGFGAITIAELIGRRARSPWPARCWLALLVALLVVPAAYQSVRCQAMSRDTRERALDVIAELAKQRGQVRVVLSPSVATLGPAWGVAYDLVDHLARPGVVFAGVVPSARAAADSGADYLVIASYREPRHIAPITILPYEDDWPFAPPSYYREIARIEPNPYETRWDILPIWYGRVTVLVLERR